MKKQEKDLGKCPICDNDYRGRNDRTGHHIFPKYWYNDGTKVKACRKCHQYEFHKWYPMNVGSGLIWSKKLCLQKWVEFCLVKGKDAFEIYPELRNISLKG